jgi:hypothetical protein
MVKRAEGDTVVGTLKKSRETRDKLLGSFYMRDNKGEIVMDGENPKLSIAAGADVQEVKAQLTQHLSVLQYQQNMLCEMAEKWVKEAVFGKGYYHGDLHAGNIMMSERKLTVIDFGNATKLNEFQQKKITLMLMAAAAGNGEGFMEGFTALLSQKSRELLAQKGDELKALFVEVMKLGNFKSSAERIGAALVRAQKLGFELPNAIYGFQQCQLRIQNTIDSFNKEITEVQKAIRLLGDAQNATVVDLKMNYDKVAAQDVVNGNNIRFALLPDNKEEILAILRDTDKDRRSWLDGLLKDGFDHLNNTVDNITEDVLLETYFRGIDGIIQGYNNTAPKVLKQSQWFSVFEKYGIQDLSKLEKDKPAYTENEHKIQSLPPEQKKALIKELKDMVREYDVIRAVRDLRKAQDEGADPQEIKRLEDIAVERFMRGRKGYLEAAMDQLDRSLGAAVVDWQEQIDAQDEATRADPVKMAPFNKEMNRRIEAKNQAMAEQSKYLDRKQIEKSTREKLKVKANLAQAKKELEPFFKLPVYGRNIELAFSALSRYVKKADDKKDPAEVERLLDSLMDELRTPIVLGMGYGSDSNTMESHVSMKDPDEFVDVMSDVINEKWRQALKNVSFWKSVKYGISISSDIEDKVLSTMDILKLIKERAFA